MVGNGNEWQVALGYDGQLWNGENGWFGYGVVTQAWNGGASRG